MKRWIVCMIVITMVASMLLVDRSAFATASHPLRDYVRSAQLFYVEKSYSNRVGDMYTDKDLASFKKKKGWLIEQLWKDPAYGQMLVEYRKLTKKERLAENTLARKSCSRTWEQIKEVSSAGQTEAGKNAELFLADLIVKETEKGYKSRQNLELSETKALIWSDEFNGENGAQPSTENWTYELGAGGWGNEELQEYTDSRENSFVSGGKLNIVANRADDGRITSARVVSKGLHSWSSGKIEVKARIPKGQGLWPAIWLWPAASGEEDINNSEIDIMEAVSLDTKSIYGSAHFYRKGQLISHSNFLSEPRTDYSKDFHVYGVEWDKTNIRWSIDGKTRATFNVEKYVGKADVKPFQQEFFLILNLAVGGKWPGAPDKTTTCPQVPQIDYVRIYQ